MLSPIRAYLANNPADTVALVLVNVLINAEEASNRLNVAEETSKYVIVAFDASKE